MIISSRVLRWVDYCARTCKRRFRTCSNYCRQAPLETCLQIVCKGLDSRKVIATDDLPFALCVTDVDGPDSPPEAVMLSGLAGAFWVRDGKGFLIIGGDDLATVETLADDLQARL